MAGTRGPAPVPKKILEMRGSWRADVNTNAPEAEQGIPDMPNDFNARSLQIWDHIVPLVNQMKVLTKQDGIVLQRYCILWSRWKVAEEFLEDNGTFYTKKDSDGEIIGMAEVPQVKQANELADKLLRIEIQFGLTPSARSRVETNTTHKKYQKPDDKSRFFKGA